MPKLYLDKDVLTAAEERLAHALTRFDHVCFSFSGGKDSSVMVQLAHRVARRLNKRFSVVFIDLEAQYRSTIAHVEEVLDLVRSSLDEVYWLCLPIQLRNAVSMLQPEWCCWDREEEHRWVRPMPPGAACDRNHAFPWFDGRPFEDFDTVTTQFAGWLAAKKGGTLGCGIGIRSDESFNRFRTIVSESKERLDGRPWTTRLQTPSGPLDAYNFYPLYDWRTEDVWGAVSRLGLLYNPVYELMWKSGLSIHKARLCQPFGDDQKQGLDLYRQIEPDTWEKLLDRVNGANFGNIYARTSLLGHLKSEKPRHLSWQAYAVFLLESLGLQAPEVRDYVYSKIDYFLRWYETNEGLPRAKMPDSKKDGDPSWERIARALEANDVWLTKLTFTSTKEGTEMLRRVKEKYGVRLFGDGKLPAATRRTREELEP